MTQTLRPYQAAALERIRAELRSGHRRVVLVAPTGSGKTTCGAEIVRAANAKGRRVVWIAHRTVLIEQASERLDAEGIQHSIAMGSASVQRKGSLTTLGSIQTLTRRTPQAADLVIVDECHHVGAEGTYARLLAHYPTAAIVGLTATLRDGMADCFDALTVAATPKQLIAEGYLAPYRGWAFMAPDVSGVHTKKGDYVESELGQVYAKSTVFADVVEKWLQHARGMRTICFAAGIENSLALVARFRSTGISAEHLDYRSLPSDRHAIFERVRTGATTVLCNYSLLGEGLDLPMLKCVVIARPTQSPILAIQMMGRGLRPWPLGGQSETCQIHDHAGVVQAHGLPDADREYSLTPGHVKPLPALTTCWRCFAIWQRGPEANACPRCGLEPVREAGERMGPAQVDEHVEVALGEVGHAPSRAEMERFKDELERTAIAKGLKPGWLVHKFLERYPDAPKPWGAFRRVRQAQARG